MLKLHLLKVEKSLKMVKNKKDLKSPRRKSMLNGGARSNNRSRTDSSNSNSSDGNIRVIIRVRPFNTRERGENCRNVIKVINDQMMIFDPKQDDEPFFYHGVQQRNRDLLKRAHKNLHFTFDRVFDHTSNNEDLFENSTKGLIEWLMNGYNCSVFVYGATGAGKTHTMLGSGDDYGVTFRTMSALFQRRDELRDEREFELGMTYLEVYNETVQDLLNPGPVLQLREDGKYGIVVAGNKFHRIEEPTRLFELLEQGNRNRTQHPTDANAESSRSHAIFQVYLRMKLKSTGEVRAAKLSMIDLAGSERGAATGFSGARFNEGANINKSLLALGNCINSLADGQKHVPYRDSKLTRLLKDSLGGNCQTIMIANVSPSSLTFEDTYNTLKYAMRATKIKSHIKKNIVNCETNIHHYIHQVEKLTAEIQELKLQLAKQESHKCEVIKVNHVEQEPRQELLPSDLDIKNQLITLYAEKRQTEERIGNISRASRLLVARKNIKEECDSRLSGICTNTPDKVSGHRRLGNAVSSLERQVANLENEIRCLNGRSDEIQEHILLCLEKAPSLRTFVSEQDNDIQCLKEQHKALCYQKEIELQNKELKLKDNLIEQFCKVLQPCFVQLKGLGYATDEMVLNYSGLVKHLQGIRSVSWEDDNCIDSGVSSSSNITEPEENSSNNKSHREIVLDRTFVVTEKIDSPIEELITEGDLPTGVQPLEESSLQSHLQQHVFEEFRNKNPSTEIGHWMNTGIEQLMTKLYDSPLDDELEMAVDGKTPLQEVQLNRTRIISQGNKTPSIVSAKHLMNKAHKTPPPSINKLNSRSREVLKENMAYVPFRARPVPLSNSVRPKAPLDKPKGILKSKARCNSKARTSSRTRK